MNDRTDRELLRAYADDGSSQAFADIVRRHADWIYSTALRLVRDRQRAEDVAQATFLVLAQRAKALPRDAVVAAWLFGVVRLTSLQSNRSEARRSRHEQAAAMQRNDDERSASRHDTDTTWNDLEPTLDMMVAKLRSSDRHAVTLRYYGRRSMEQVAEELGVSEEAARKRVTRAVEKLRDMYRRRGVMLTAGALEAAVIAHLVQPAPAALCAAIAAATGCAGGGGAAVGGVAGELARHATHALYLAKMKAAAAIAAAVLVVASGASAIVALKPARTASASPAAGAAASTAPASRPAADDDLTRLIDTLEAAEKSIGIIHVKNFEMTVETMKPGEKTWTATPQRTSGSAWFDGLNGRRARVHIARTVSPWVGGAAPFLDASYDLGFDGVEGHQIHLTSGPLGATRPDPVAALSDGPSAILVVSRTASGIGYALPVFADGAALQQPGVTLAAHLRRRVAENNPPAMAFDNVGPFRALRLRWGDPTTVMEAIWLDPARGHAILRQERTEFRPATRRLPAASVTERVKIVVMANVAPGIWLPTESLRENPETRIHVKSESITVNDPRYNDAVFNAKIPAGWMVSDHRAASTRGQSWIVMPNATTQPLVAGQVLPRVPLGKPALPEE